MTCNSREQRELWRKRGGDAWWPVGWWLVKQWGPALHGPSLRVLFANNSILFVRRVVPSLSTVSKPEEILIITRDCVFPVTYFARIVAYTPYFLPFFCTSLHFEYLWNFYELSANSHELFYWKFIINFFHGRRWIGILFIFFYFFFFSYSLFSKLDGILLINGRRYHRIRIHNSIDLLLSVFDEALYRSLITSNTIGRALLICSSVNHFNQLPSINFHVNRSELFQVVCREN